MSSQNESDKLSTVSTSRCDVLTGFRVLRQEVLYLHVYDNERINLLEVSGVIQI